MAVVPTATFAPVRRLVVIAAIPLAAFVGWGVWHALAVTHAIEGRGHQLALTWAVSFLLLWWVPIAWREKPVTVTPGEQQELDALKVTVQIPVYNEDGAALTQCICSLFEQTRLPDRVHVVNDGSMDEAAGLAVDYDETRAWFLAEAERLGIEATWTRTVNRGKRHAQMEVLAGDDGDIFITLDSDSILDRQAIGEGLKPFRTPKVTSVAGQVVVLNSRDNLLTFMTSMLYLPFTRGYRSVQSVLKRVMVNSGALAFYRADVVRACAGAYENEQFRGQPMQLSDDSMLTMYAALDGDTVHQPSAVCFTLAPVALKHYLNQQFRWMRGWFVRSFWWFRYLPITSIAFWMPVMDWMRLVLGIVVPVVLFADPAVRGNLGAFAVSIAVVNLGIYYIYALRFFSIDRSDESKWFRLALFATAPMIGIWGMLVLRPMHLYALFTCWKVGKWGTRDSGVEVAMSRPALATPGITEG